MRTLKLHHPTGHPYWQRDEYTIELPDGTIYDKTVDYKKYRGDAHRIIVKKDGIYYQHCGASSGGGKTNYKEPWKIVDASQYNNIEYIGEPLVMSQTLLDDLKENEMEL